jgi:hypothetical protein
VRGAQGEVERACFMMISLVRSRFGPAAQEVSRRPLHVDGDIAANSPARLLKALQKCSETVLPLRIVGGQMHQYADTPLSRYRT